MKFIDTSERGGQRKKASDSRMQLRNMGNVLIELKRQLGRRLSSKSSNDLGLPKGKFEEIQIVKSPRCFPL